MSASAELLTILVTETAVPFTISRLVQCGLHSPGILTCIRGKPGTAQAAKYWEH
uniref:Uncharacterized protein n=1 Tax=Anguilla anguilla TaxID=7936 RepID=A0A0E9WFU4_ANGAN